MKLLRALAGFSMIEVAISLGIVSFALLTVLALLPMGINSNRVSVEETRAVSILSAVDSDLRNTHPLAANGKSLLLGLDLPYALDANGDYVINPALGVTTALGSGTTTGLDDRELPVAISSNPKPRFQVSVIYTGIPNPGTAASLQARLVVNWPAIAGTSPLDLTDPAKTSGCVEAVVSFPPP